MNISLSSIYFVYVLFFLLLGHSAFTQSSLKREALQEDFDYLITQLRLQHQGLYNYVDRAVVDQQIDSIRATLTQPMSLLDFYQTVRYTAALTNEGHTEIDLPRRSEVKIGLSKSFLPLTVLFCDQTLVVTQNYGKAVSQLEKGMKILTINGQTVEAIVQRFLPLLPSDGFNETSKYKWLSGVSFALLYRLVYGKAKHFELSVQAYDSPQPVKLRLDAIPYTRFKAKNANFPSKSFDYNQFTFKIIADSIAYLSVPDFGDDDMDYQALYADAFKQIAQLNIEHLIMDMQANTGGTEGNENLLFSYLAQQPLQKYKKVTMLETPYRKNKDDEDYIEDQWQWKDSIAERGAFTLMSDYYSNLNYQAPEPDLIYDGKLYVLTSGLTFSGGAEFSSLVKMSDRGIFIGVETGGTYEGNVSGYSETIKLPNSKIKIDLPTVHFQINVEPKIRGRGILPDHTVPQRWEDYLNDRNAKLDFTLDLIQN